jgi:hypothetical protein
MTWDQLETLHGSGLFDVQSHTYWHPNFNVERRRLPPSEFAAFVTAQLVRPRTVLGQQLGIDADLLAWPFGIHDEELASAARKAGYVAGFTLERRLVSRDASVMALPRFLVTESATERMFSAMLPKEPS